MQAALSVIIANANGMPEIGWCLTALQEQWTDETIEVIVVEAGGLEAARALQKQFPWVHILCPEKRLSIPEMRNLALESSRGEIIAVLEDHEVVPSNWCRKILAAHREYPQVAAVAGAIENEHVAGITSWAAFFCEYCAFMSPVRFGFTSIVPGNNIAYKRWALEVIGSEDRKNAFWESSLHPVLVQRGYQFRMEPDIAVSHQKEFGFLEYIWQRFHYSRYYAGYISRQRSLLFRLVRSAGCFVLPSVLMQRILKCGFSKRRFLRELLLASPLLLIFTFVWAMGEFTGYLFGEGRSLTLIK